MKWATCDVGADSPEGYGDYFAWGETSPKSEYTEKNSKTYGNSAYNRDIGGDSILDVARANWGGSWRLPTKAECEELVDRCTWEWTTQKGIDGCKVTGPNGNSIFLPAAGSRYGSSLSHDGNFGFYLSSTPYDYYDSDSGVCALFFCNGYWLVNWDNSFYGQSVRSVTE